MRGTCAQQPVQSQDLADHGDHEHDLHQESEPADQAAVARQAPHQHIVEVQEGAADSAQPGQQIQD